MEKDSLGQINGMTPPPHTHTHYRVLRMRLAGLSPKLPAFASSATVEEDACCKASSINEQLSSDQNFPPAMLSCVYPPAGRVHTGPATVSQVAMVSWLLAAWLLAGDPGGLPPVALPEAFHDILGRDS